MELIDVVRTLRKALVALKLTSARETRIFVSKVGSSIPYLMNEDIQFGEEATDLLVAKASASDHGRTAHTSLFAAKVKMLG